MWSFEEKGVPKTEQNLQGLLPAQYETITFIGVTALFIFGVYMSQTTNAALFYIFAPMLARLFTLDLRHCLLPNLYTYPLLFGGIIFAPLLIPHLSYKSSLIGATLGILLPYIFSWLIQCIRRTKSEVIGGGDLKLMAGAMAWIGIDQLSNFILIACLFSSILMLFARQKPLPFGPGLILSFYMLLVFPKEVNSLLLKLFSLI